MLGQAYRQTGYLSFVAALPKGRQRRANLVDLHSRAVQFAGDSLSEGKNLATFVEFIEKLIDEGGDYRPADVIAPGENAVRIMSVHKSKGLEFPVVFLTGMERRFNFRDMSADCLFDESATLGLSIIDAHSNTRRRSMAGQVIAARKKSAAIAEEMRILYVALTRARERLVLAATRDLDSCRSIVRSAAFAPAGPLPEWMLSSCRSSLEWLLCGLSDRREIHGPLATGTDLSELANSGLLSVRVVGADEQDDLAGQITAMKERRRTGAPAGKGLTTTKTRKLVDAAASSLLWRYPFQTATEACAKTSVTQFTHRGDEWRPADLSGSLSRVPLVLNSGLAVEPRTIGTAAHVIIQSLDITGPCDEKAVRDTVDRLISSGMVATAAAQAVEPAAIAAFFETEIGVLVRRNAGAVAREWPFTFAMPLAEYEPASDHGAETEQVIVQGIIDMLVRLPERLVIVDFKTDSIASADADARAKAHAAQLSLYGRAAAAILHVSRIEKWLYFLSCRELVQVR